MLPIAVPALLLVLAAPLAPVSRSPGKIAAPKATTGGAAAESADTTRSSAPDAAATLLREVTARLGTRLTVTPAEQALLDEVAASLRDGKSAKADRAWRKLIESRAAHGQNVDVHALLQYVLRASYLDTTEDLKAYADKVASMNAAKEELREHIDGVRAAVAAAAPKAGTIELTTVDVSTKRSPGKKLVRAGKKMARTVAQWEAYAKRLEDEYESVGELSQMDNLMLQDMLQKQQQMFELLSNLSKSMHDTAKAIIANTKG